ncbi:MAG: tRNA (N6-isopentenyl adenosine(37)-C2)-methylthiotransferase MiaB [Proteobacteria bacterium]|nr:tRNA (N6-isopentenyl adenosine(37)-C2)-methylthiotransferase MiaB [Pseudomonadota bacterium]MCP4917929.1 tRNA (N6-isopentenyl adenosine(37)-C2)-methylthiotransferase MiaB [Pseudomonadota bacterium]
MKKVYIKTFGCQMNDYDSAKIKALLGEDGYVATASPDDADLILVNTCSVREKPEHKLRSFIGEVRHHRERGARIGIAGCMAQHAGASLFKRYRKDVDLVFGPDHVPNVRELVQRTETERVLENSFLDNAAFAFVQETHSDGKVGAFVTIQKGCDNKCTFCIVPMTRGTEVSRPSAQILDEVRALVDQGVAEVTLIGQNVNSYGLKTDEKTFAELLYAVAELPGVERIRYTTSHPRDMGPDVVQAYRDLPQLTSHLHLPVQSGSDRMLKRMKRFYTRERYLEVVSDLRSARPGLSLTTDIIVGFPGETDADFDETMTLLEEVGFDGSFSFKYSPRPGTPALRLSDEPVLDRVAGERLKVFQKRQQELTLVSNKRDEGRVFDVLVEGPSRWDDDVMCGRTGTFKMVNFPGTADLIGTTVAVEITRGFTNTLRGELA